MILVVGRPALDERGRLHGDPALIALAAAAAGGRVELVGSVGDDPDGDRVAVELGRAGIGHAALLRDPAGLTLRGSSAAAPAGPRLEAPDVELALNYLVDCRVLVVAEWLGEEVLAVARRAAAYHGAQLIVLIDTGAPEPSALPERATLLRRPQEGGAAFADLVGRYAADVAAGEAPPDAWRRVLAVSGWTGSSESQP